MKVLSGLLVALVAVAHAQDGPHFKKSTPSANLARAVAPVTVAEANAVLSKVQTALVAIAKPAKPVTLTPIAGSGTASTEQILVKLDGLFMMAKSSFKSTPKKVKALPNRLKVSGESAKAAIRLIEWGALGKVGPLVTNKDKTISPADFGDAIGLFVARIADLTHTPLPKWSPYMMGVDGK